MKILPIKEQYRIKDMILQERLDTIVPKYMKQFDIDCYLVMSKEYNEDFVFDVLTPAAYLTARRITILVFMNVEGNIKRFSLSMRDPSLEKYYEPRFHLNQETQMEALNKLLDEFKPKNICIDISKDHKYGDGLSHGLYELLLDELKEEYKSILTSNPLLPIKIMEVRTPTEISLYPQLMALAFEVIEEAFSTKVIEIGKTTCEEVEYFMMDQVTQAGLQYWFKPDINLQREGVNGSLEGDVIIQRGDLLHCDFGIKYMNICSDTQRLCYVLKENESSIPEILLEGMKQGNQFQDIVRKNMIEGKTGDEVLMDSLKEGFECNLQPCLYSHPCNLYGHGPGPTIGLWNRQAPIPIDGAIPLSNNTVWALELNVKYEGITFPLEETVLMDENGVHFLYPNRDTIYTIK